ncbi:Transcriptional regulator [gamma proteobacterium HdN1]|nr:Transcriptional regulator [gamma proteobacterium HdN1]
MSVSRWGLPSHSSCRRPLMRFGTVLAQQRRVGFRCVRLTATSCSACHCVVGVVVAFVLGFVRGMQSVGDRPVHQASAWFAKKAALKYRVGEQRSQRMRNADKHLVSGIEDSPRGRILSAAAHLFREKGYERTTVRDLAQEVGIQSGSIFHHFRAKEDILREVMIDVILFNTERMEQAVAEAASTVEKLRALIRCELISITGDTSEAMAVLISEWRCLGADSQQYILGLRAKYEAIWLRVLVQLKEEALLADGVDVFVLRRLLTGALGASHYWYNPKGPMGIDAITEQAMLLVVGGTITA